MWQNLPVVCLCIMVGTAVVGSVVATLLLRSKSKSSRHLVRKACSIGAMLMILAAGVTVALQRYNVESMNPWWGLLFVACSIIPAWLTGIIAAAIAAKYAPARGTEDKTLSRWWWPLAILISGGIFAFPIKPPGSSTEGEVASPAPSPNPSPVHTRTLPSDFRYQLPPEISKAAAFAVAVQAEGSLGVVQPGGDLCLFEDSRLLAFNSPSGLSVCDLNSASVVKTFAFQETLGSITFSPNGGRVICDLKRDHRIVFVCDLSSGQTIPLPRPKLREVPAGKKFWWADEEVLCYGQRGLEFLSLKSLEMEFMKSSARWEKLSTEEQEKWKKGPLPKASEHDFAIEPGLSVSDAELPDVEDPNPWVLRSGKFLGVSARLHPVWKKLPVTFEDGDQFLLTPDAGKVVKLHAGQLDVFYLGFGQDHATTYRISMPHGPDSGPRHDAIGRAMKSKVLTALVYAPMLNPLNGIVVGPDRTRVKAVVRFWKWEGPEGIIWVSALFDRISPGDVISDLHLYGKPNHDEFVLDTPHRWWVQLGPQSDQTSYPTPTKTELEELTVATAEPPATPKAPTVTPPPDPKPEVPDDTERRLKEFIFEHHRLATTGEFKEFAKHFAPTVDFLKQGNVTPAYIQADRERAWAKFLEWRETVSLPIQILEPEPQHYEVTYSASIHWKALNGSQGAGTFKVTMEIQLGADGFRISREKNEKVNPK